jgi:diguanylate cyclase (GGDEF)-like protein/PAS domain S-box-containing protein
LGKNMVSTTTHTPSSPKPARQSLSERIGVFPVLGLILVTLWALVLWFSAFQRDKQLSEADQDLSHLCEAVAQHTLALVKAVDADLRVMDQWLQANPALDPLHDARFTALVDGMRQSAGGLVELYLVGQDGGVHQLPEGVNPSVASATDREYFQQALKLGPGKAYFASPVLGRLSGKWQIPVARQMTAPVAGMAMVVATLDVERLQRYHEAFRVLPLGTVSLVRGDGVLLSRTPLDAKLMGRNLSDQPAFQTMRQQERGSLVGASVLTDGQRRLARFQRLEGYPLTVTVSRGEDDILAGYYARRTLVLAMVLGISLLSVLFAWRLQLAQRASRQARLEAQRTAATLLAAKHALPLGRFQTDAQGQLESVNDAWRKAHGLSNEATPEDWPRVLDMPEVALQAMRDPRGYLAAGEHTLQLANGRQVQLRVCRADIEMGGQVIGSTGIVEDVTRQRQLEKTQRMLMQALDHSTDIVVQSDLAGNFLYVNAALLRFAGYPLDTPVELVNQRVIAGEDYFERRDKEILPIARQQGFWQGESRLTDAQGQVREFNHLLMLHHAADGSVSHITGILRDITAQKKTEQALVESEHLMSAIADHLPLRVSFVDREQRYRFLNIAYERAFGKPREALYGMQVREVLGEQAYQRVRPHLERALRGEAVTFEGEIKTAEKYQSYRADYIPQFGADGVTPIGCVAMITDTTDQRREERRLSELSQRDVLTGLYNRAGFDARLHNALALSQASGATLALLYLDMDRFKQVNDTLGHGAGDFLLQAFGGRLTKALRAGDVVARLGGDEFAVLLDGLEGDAPQVASRVATSIVNAMREPFHFEEQTLNISTSVGAALHRGGQPVTAQELLRRADEQLYEAKRAGRDRFALEAAQPATETAQAK